LCDDELQLEGSVISNAFAQSNRLLC
jgi:hypothetical protein